MKYCTDCGSDEVMAFSPGQDGEATDLFRLTPSYPGKAWCSACWQKRWAQPAPLQSSGKAKTGPLTQD